MLELLHCLLYTYIYKKILLYKFRRGASPSEKKGKALKKKENVDVPIFLGPRELILHDKILPLNDTSFGIKYKTRKR